MVEYTQREQIDGHDYGLWLLSVLLLSMAVTLGVFSAAYVQDLNTLRTVPGAVWDALCGRPDPDSLTLPLLMTGSTLCFIASGAVYSWKRRRQGRQSADKGK